MRSIKANYLKTVLAALLMLLAVSVASTAVYAEKPLADTLIFEPAGGGKFIYCNNTEGIFRDSLADSSNPNPRYLMSNQNLTPDRYYIYLTHINYTYGYDSAGRPSGLGFDVELDLEITAKEDSTLKIYRAAFQTPKVQRYLDENNDKQFVFHTWGAEDAVATMLDHDIYRLNSDVVYKNKGYTEKTINIKKGQTVWLSEFVEDYAPCGMVLPVFMTADTELISGMVDMNVAVFKSKDGNVGNRSDFDPNKVAFGSYLRDRCIKGVADTLPEVETELSYEIDDTVADGEYLPVSFTNQYAADGVTTDKWVTHLNPQDDIWSKYITAESDMLTLKYYDPSKLSYYGKNVPESERDSIWVFDTKHSDTKDYVPESGVSANDYSPNYLLSAEKDNHGFGCSLGNYGVTTRYRINIANNGSKTRYFLYNAQTTSNIVVTMKNADGTLSREQEQPVVAKDGLNIPTTCAYTALPPHSEKTFVLEVLLPVNYLGGVINTFNISDTKPEMKFMTSQKTFIDDYTTIQNNYYDEFMSKANTETKELFSGNLNNFEVTETAYGYMLRFKAWDANPNFQGLFLNLTSDLYFLDKNFCLIGTSHFDKYPKNAVFSDGKFIVSFYDGTRLFSIDGAEWQDCYWPKEEDAVLDKILVRLNGEYLNFDRDPMLLNDRTLVPMRYIFETLGLNVIWSEVEQKAEAYNANMYISFTIGSSTATVNGKEFTMDTYPVLDYDRTMIPLRFLSETLGYLVSWNDTAKTVIIDDYPALPEHTQKYYAIYKEGYRNDRTEVAFFDLTGGGEHSLIWDGSIIPANNNSVANDVKYYYDETSGSWIQFESGYGAISNNASGFIRSNLYCDFK